MSRARCLRPIAAAEDRHLEPFGSSHSVASGARFWREPIGDCDVCAIPIVREVGPTDVHIRVRRIRPSAVRERRSWGDRRPQDMLAQLLKRLAILRRDGDVAV
jgi:hypothetical protein